MLWRDPHYLWLLAGVLGLAAVLWLLWRRRAVALRAFAEAALLARLTPALDSRRPLWRLLLRLTALALIAVALAGPKWGFEWREVKREGVDVIVALDTSRSMLATDVRPNRLERAKLAVLDLLPRLQGDRIGLVAFAGTAFLECPLTVDYTAFERSLRGIEVGIIPRGGTALERAIDTSLTAFEARQGKYEALILITDGESHEGDVAAATARAAERGVKIFTVGIGTPEGELIPEADGGYVKDRRGQVIKSRLDEETLKQIAIDTGGAYVHGLGPSLGLDQVFDDHIAKMERREVASALERRYEERFQLPLAAALLLLALEWLVPLRRGAGRRPSGAALAALLLCLPWTVGFFDPPGDRAAEGNQLYDAGEYAAAASKYGEGLIDAPASPLLQFNLATALYKQGQYDEALKVLSKLAASGDPQWIGPAAYNMGNAQYRLGEAQEASAPQQALAIWQQALTDYKRAMVADPADLDAKFNHELVTQRIEDLRRKLEEQEQDEKEQPEPQDQEDEQEQQEQQDQDQQEQQDQQDQEQQDQQDQEQQQEEQQQDQQEQGEQPQEPQPEEQPPAQDDAGQGEEEPEPQPQEDGEPAQPPPPDPEEGAGEPEPGGATAADDGQPSAEEQAAHAVLDTARSEELGPQDLQRPAGVAGLGEPGRDW